MEVTPAQLAKLQQRATRPVFGVHWQFSGSDEYIACTGAFEFDSQDYTPAGVNILTILNSSAARLSMVATATRIAQVQSGVWRNGICRIYLFPAVPGDSLVFNVGDEILCLDGIINFPDWKNELITVEIVNKYLTGKTGPVWTLNQVCNFIPPSGTTIEWEGDSQVVTPSEGSISSSGRELRLGPGSGY